MNIEKLLESLMGIKRPMSLLDLQNRGFTNTSETNKDSRVQIFQRGNYKALYDSVNGEVITILKERRNY